MRTYCRNVRYPNTADQQNERNWFVGMVRFAAQARPALLLGFKKAAYDAHMTEGNYFVNRNKQHFHRNGEKVETDYEKLVIASGPAADVVFHEPVLREHEALSVEYDRNTLFSRSSGDDAVYLYVYSEEMNQGMLSAPAARRQRKISMQLPSAWAGTTVHIYGFVVDHDGRPSNSTYIGAGRVNHYYDGTAYIPLNKSWMDFVEVANKVNNDNTPDTIESTMANINNCPEASVPIEAPPE